MASSPITSVVVLNNADVIDKEVKAGRAAMAGAHAEDGTERARRDSEADRNFMVGGFIDRIENFNATLCIAALPRQSCEADHQNPRYVFPNDST